jgi:hypothetical protein
MTPVVVDTDVVSFLFKNHPIGLLYDPELAGRVGLISFMTVAELERWTIQYRWGEHRVDWLQRYLSRFTSCRPARISAVSGRKRWSPPKPSAAVSKVPTHGSRRRLCYTERHL